MNDYITSNNIDLVYYNKLSKKEYNSLLNSVSNKRKQAAQNLLNYLCDKYHINRIKLIISEDKRKIIKNGQIYGFYKKGISITIYNKTAKTNKEVSIKSFIDTLLHEFMHHYDTEYLKIQTMHTAGFYKRISDLEKKLK